MKIKHKLLSDYQYVSPDKKIFLIKSGTIVEEYCYKIKGEIIPLDKDIIDVNPEIFELIDWKAELMSFMKVNKMPQPAQLGKKLIPFFEEMVLSSIQQNNTSSSNDTRELERRENEIYSLKREVERKELDIESREKRIRDKEEDLEIRQKRVEKRESEYKEDIKVLQKREDELRIRNKDVVSKEIDVQDKLDILNEKERNLDRTILSSSKDFEDKYAELQSKIDEDLASILKREKNLDEESKRLKELEKNIEVTVDLLLQSNKHKIYQDLESDFRKIQSDLKEIHNIWNLRRDDNNITIYTEKLLKDIDDILRLNVK